MHGSLWLLNNPEGRSATVCDSALISAKGILETARRICRSIWYNLRLAPSSKTLCVLSVSRHSRSLGLPTSPWVVGALKGIPRTK